MRNTINSAFASTALAAFAASTEAAQPVPTAETVAAITKPEAAKRAATTAKLKAARTAAKPSASKPEAKPGKRASAKPSATAPQPDASTAKADRIAADRSAVSKLYSAFEANRDSVPVKPLSAFKPKPSHVHANARNPSARQAAAIAVAFSAAGRKLATGVAVPRVFELNGSRVCIENGAISDAISSGLITVSGDSAETEKLTLRCKPAVIAGLIGPKATKAGNLL